MVVSFLQGRPIAVQKSDREEHEAKCILAVAKLNCVDNFIFFPKEEPKKGSKEVRGCLEP